MLAGCQTLSPVERRIDRNPAMFDRLSDHERHLVLHGEVEEGMSRDGVFLSWGRPDVVQDGSRNGKNREEWLYLGSTPVQTTSFSVGYPGYGYHPFYSAYGCHPTYGYGYGTTVDYVPHVERTVEFTNGKVIAWERRR